MRELAEEKKDERRQKLRKIRRKRRVTVSTFVAILVLVLWLLFLFYNSSYFNLKEFVIIGNKHLLSEKIISLASVDLGFNILKVPLNKVENRISSDPWVESVKVTRILPDKLRIKVTERQVIAAVAYNDTYLLVDKSAMVLDSRQNVDDLTLPMIRDVKLNEVKMGRSLNSKSLWNALACLAFLESDLKNQINLVSASSVERLSLYTKEGVEILYGDAKDMTKKNYVLKKILFEPGGKVIYIDVRVASNPAVKRLKQ